MNVIDSDYIDRQITWSELTFGPGLKTLAVINHIKKELDEIIESPTDIYEWVDVIILALDGAWRAGYTPQDIINALYDKQSENFMRIWPNWRDFDENTPIEHVRQ